MKELRCYKCKKIVAYIEPGSKIAKGTIHTCVNCIYPDTKPVEKPSSADDLFDDMFGGLFKK